MTAAGANPVPSLLLVILRYTSDIAASNSRARTSSARLPHLGRATLLSSGQVGHIVAREITGKVATLITSRFC